jgi:hypothetical protein
MLSTFSPNLSLNASDERLPKWRTKFGCWRWILWYGRHGTQTHSEPSYYLLLLASSLIIDRETLDKLIQSAPNTGLSSTTLSTGKDLPPPLDPKDYPQVRFWTTKSFEEYCDSITGETDGLATQQRRRGRRRKSESNEDRHPYLENKDGSAIPREVLINVGQKARRLWQSLNSAGLAPSSWGKASEDAYLYFVGGMLNVPEFEFFRYCEGNWKVTRWATKAYASWAHNHVNSGEAGDRKTVRPNKRKHGYLEDPSLLQIEDDKDEDAAPISPCNSLPALSPSTLVHVQVCSHYL